MGVAQTALQTILIAEAGEELVDLAECRALPVQVLDHVHHWLVIGTRHKPTHGDLGALDLLVRALAVTLGEMTNQATLVTLQEVFDDDLQRYDFAHGFRIPIERILTMFEDGLTPPLDEVGFKDSDTFANKLQEWYAAKFKEGPDPENKVQRKMRLYFEPTFPDLVIHFPTDTAAGFNASEPKGFNLGLCTELGPTSDE